MRLASLPGKSQPSAPCPWPGYHARRHKCRIPLRRVRGPGLQPWLSWNDSVEREVIAKQMLVQAEE
jgi:hypothetical protein